MAAGESIGHMASIMPAPKRYRTPNDKEQTKGPRSRPDRLRHQLADCLSGTTSLAAARPSRPHALKIASHKINKAYSLVFTIFVNVELRFPSFRI